MLISDFHLRRVKQILTSGGIISYPSDTIAALGVLPLFKSSLRQLISYKKRSFNKGLILLASEVNQLAHFVEPNELKALKYEYQNNKKSYPTTYLVKIARDLDDEIGYYLKGENTKIAIRLSDAPHIQKICQAVNCAIVSTSLNLTQKESLTRNYQVKKRFHQLDYYLAIEPSNQPRSSIVDLETKKIIRPEIKTI